MKGFTITELMIVLAIIGIVIAVIAFPTDSSTRSTSQVRIQDPNWERIESPDSYRTTIYRARTPTGWIIYTYQSIVFIPDQDHLWIVR